MIIQNVSYRDLENGNHYYSENIVLIQIVDPCMIFPKPLKSFNKVYQFEFSDSDNSKDIVWDARMSTYQAKKILCILSNCFKKDKDVIIQCLSGKSRSGAIVEIGTLIGFKETNTERSPNNYMLSIFYELLK